MTRNLPAWITPQRALALGLAPVRARAPLPALPVEPEKSPRTPKTARAKLVYSKRRRAKLKAARRCINGWNHGRATHGCRCKRCADVHSGSNKKKRSK